MGQNRKKLCENEIVTISARCRERFLPLDRPELHLLSDAGVTFSGASTIFPKYEIRRENPRWHTLIHTVEGEGHVVSGGHEYRLARNTIWIGPAGIGHHYWIVKSPWKLAWLCMAPGNRFRFSPAKPLLTHAHSPAEFDHVIRQIVDETAPGRPGYSALAEGYARILYLLVKQDITASHLPPVDSRQIVFDQLQREIRNNPGGRWTVDAMQQTARLPVSKDRFRQLCEQYLGKTPVDMLTGIRMETAREILAATDYCIYTVAGMVGYENEYAFSTAFRRVTGQSPSRYRSSCRRSQP